MAAAPPQALKEGWVLVGIMQACVCCQYRATTIAFFGKRRGKIYDMRFTSVYYPPPLDHSHAETVGLDRMVEVTDDPEPHRGRTSAGNPHQINKRRQNQEQLVDGMFVVLSTLMSSCVNCSSAVVT